EVSDELGEPLWAVTRPLQNAEWGLVAQAQRAEMLSSLAPVRQAMVLVDLILAFIFSAVVFVWRRSYTSALSRREMELTERHAGRLHAILDTAFGAIFTFDRDGRVRWANHAAETMVGQPASVITELPIQKLIHWDHEGESAALPQ